MPEKRKKTIDAAADRQTMTELYETYEQKMLELQMLFCIMTGRRKMQSMRLLLEWSRICQDARM